MATALFLVALAGGSPEAQGSYEPAVELRALSGYLELYRQTLASSQPSAARASAELLADLRARLDRFLEVPDLPSGAQAQAIAIYHDLAKATVGAARTEGATAPAAAEKAALREMYLELIRRAEAIGVDAGPLELEMISRPQVGLEPAEVYERLVRLRPRLIAQLPGLRREERDFLTRVISRLLQEPSWPELDAGAALTGVLELLLGSVPRGAELPEKTAVAGKLADWTARLLASEAARESELAQGTALIHLYRSLELAGRGLDSGQRAAALKGLLPLVPPILSDAGPAREGTLRSVEIGAVRLPTGGREAIPALSPPLCPGGLPGHLLVPRKFYQVELICGQEDGRRSFWVLARAGSEGRMVLPRNIPLGMVPITAADTGRVTFLADRRPWSIRRFLLAFQRSWNTFSDDPQAVQRIIRHSVLREISLPGGVEPSYGSLTGLLNSAPHRHRLEETFWMDVGEEQGRRAAFEIAGAVLSGNTGLRDTALTLPTVAEANRLYREGERFGLEEPAYGVFNATRLVPDPSELKPGARYAIRAVQTLASP